jgi:hypothetical protein
MNKGRRRYGEEGEEEWEKKSKVKKCIKREHYAEKNSNHAVSMLSDLLFQDIFCFPMLFRKVTAHR